MRKKLPSSGRNAALAATTFLTTFRDFDYLFRHERSRPLYRKCRALRPLPRRFIPPENVHRILVPLLEPIKQPGVFDAEGGEVGDGGEEAHGRV
jgi:hypothetical protein